MEQTAIERLRKMSVEEIIALTDEELEEFIDELDKEDAGTHFV